MESSLRMPNILQKITSICVFFCRINIKEEPFLPFPIGKLYCSSSVVLSAIVRSLPYYVLDLLRRLFVLVDVRVRELAKSTDVICYFPNISHISRFF